MRPIRCFSATRPSPTSDFVHRAIDYADLIINVGHDVIEKPPFFMSPDGVEVIHVNFFSASVDPVYFPQVEVVGDIANSIWQLSEEITPQPHWDFANFIEVRDAADAHIAADVADARFPIYPQRLVADVRTSDARRRDHRAGQRHLQNLVCPQLSSAVQPNTVLLDNALATMGAGLPSAMAAHWFFPIAK